MTYNLPAPSREAGARARTLLADWQTEALAPALSSRDPLRLEALTKVSVAIERQIAAAEAFRIDRTLGPPLRSLDPLRVEARAGLRMEARASAVLPVEPSLGDSGAAGLDAAAFADDCERAYLAEYALLLLAAEHARLRARGYPSEEFLAEAVATLATQVRERSYLRHFFPEGVAPAHGRFDRARLRATLIVIARRRQADDHRIRPPLVGGEPELIDRLACSGRRSSLRANALSLDPAESAIARSEAAELRRAINTLRDQGSLDDTQLAVLWLRYVEDYDSAETGHLVGISRDNVRQICSRKLALLNAALCSEAEATA